jgi:plastocyanin
VGISIGLAAFVAASFVAAVTLAPDAGAAANVSVIISDDCGGPDFCFRPSHITISDGDTVTWTNDSAIEHLVGPCDEASCDGQGPGTGTDGAFLTAAVAPGATFSHTFRGTGTYVYFCAIHGFTGMSGVVTVNAVTPTTPSTSPPSTAQPGPTTASTTASTSGGSAPVSAAATTAAPTGPRLARTGSTTGGTLAVGLGALVLGLAAWGVCTPRRSVVSRLRR